MCSLPSDDGQKGSLSWRNRISLHDIAIGTTPAVERKEEIRSSGWYSQVKLRGDVQLTGANAQWILLSWTVKREEGIPTKQYGALDRMFIGSFGSVVSKEVGMGKLTAAVTAQIHAVVVQF